MLFDDWAGLIRTVTVGVLAYVALVALLRVSGKRTLAKMNAFDFVVTVALGSTLATILLSSDVALAEGIAAFLTLVGAQYVVAWLSTRSAAVEKLVKSEPTLLVHDGRFLDAAMRQERVTRAEVLAALREQGMAEVEKVGAVVLETDGSLTALPAGHGDTLRGVKRAPAAS